MNALGGNDVVDATSLEADGIQLTMNGGLGIDHLRGSEGNDLINGGDGDDVALMGAGDDVFVWNPGDDNDTLEGQAGFDRMLFNGANVAEGIDVAANGGRVRFFRNIASVTMDLDDVEAIDLNALGGADVTVVNDLSGTDVSELKLDLGAGDAQLDNVIVHGTNDDDVAQVFGDASGTAVIGLAAQVNITAAEAANDRLTVNALAGDDVVEASGLSAGAIQLTANGGAGNDVLVGGEGNDVLNGEAGDDVLIGGPGTDVLDGSDGDDIEIQLVADGDTVRSATVADLNWLAAHARNVDGTSVLDVRGKARMVVHPELRRLIDEATAAAASTVPAPAPQTTAPEGQGPTDEMATAPESPAAPGATASDAPAASEPIGDERPTSQSGAPGDAAVVTDAPAEDPAASAERAAAEPTASGGESPPEATLTS